MAKEVRIYNAEKSVSLIVVLGKLDSYMKKSEIRTFSNTIYKSKLKMYYRLKCKTRYYKTPRGKHRQNTL